MHWSVGVSEKRERQLWKEFRDNKAHFGHLSHPHARFGDPGDYDKFVRAACLWMQFLHKSHVFMRGSNFQTGRDYTREPKARYKTEAWISKLIIRKELYLEFRGISIIFQTFFLPIFQWGCSTYFSPKHVKHSDPPLLLTQPLGSTPRPFPSSSLGRYVPRFWAPGLRETRIFPAKKGVHSERRCLNFDTKAYVWQLFKRVTKTIFNYYV